MTTGERSPDARRRSVRRTYDEIAAHFASTREYPWPEVESFLEGRTGAVGLDLGCGNGRHAETMVARVDRVVGVDVSEGLLRTAIERAELRGYAEVFDAVHADASSIPLGTSSVDLAVYVATLHHLPTRDRRVESLDELSRVLAPGGVALVSAWSTAHDRFADHDGPTGFDTTVDWTLPGGETVPRFYHIYAPEEFEVDLASSALRVEDVHVSSGNCYAVVSGSQ